MGAHARFSPSAAHRRLNCTPSLVQEEKYQDEESIYAAEGSAGHELAEHYINEYLMRPTKRPVSNFYTNELVSKVEEYVSYVTEVIEDAKRICKTPLFLVEQRVDASNYVSECFGTSDFTSITDKVAHVIDLKLGRGVAVNAENNPQLMIYGLGILSLAELLYDIEIVRMTIVQPRLNSISTWEITTEELKTWGEKVLKPRGAMALMGAGEFKAGSWCRFCKARHQCRARADQFLELAKMEFREPSLLTDDEIPEVLKAAEDLSKWVKDVYEYAQEKAITQGKKWAGFELVESNTKRKFISDEEVIKAAKNAGYEDIYKHSILGITEMKKLMGDQTFYQVLGHLIEKPQGKLKLVPESSQK
jgi:hypothetical protein